MAAAAARDGPHAAAPAAAPPPMSAPLHRYNARLPPSYRPALAGERALQLRALRALAAAILAGAEDATRSHSAPPALPEDPATAEGYERPVERDLAAFEKGVTRFLDLKYQLTAGDYPPFVSVLLRGAATHALDMGLRSKLARCVARVLRKRQCVLPNGVPFRPILDIIQRVHLDCVDGGPFIGKDVRDAHCRNMLALLERCRDCVPAEETADRIYAEHGRFIDAATPDRAFEHLLVLAHTLPTRGGASLGWLPDALAKFPTLANAPEWDAAWLGLFCRVAKHQPAAVDWTPHLPYMFSRIVASFKLPLGSAAPQHPVERRCPHHCHFMIVDRTISAAAIMVVYTLSPRRPSAKLELERLVALVANFFHPSNGGRWTANLGSFLHHVAVALSTRVTAERAATAAGVTERVVGTSHTHAIAPAEDRLTPAIVDEVAALLLPLVQQGLHSKSGPMTIQAASASRDLAVVAPHIVIEPLLGIAAECLESLSSPHRTSAALKMLAALTPVFLDPELCPEGAATLPQALTLTLPGIDPNDPAKTESTLRFIAGAAARIQSMLSSGEGSELAYFVDEYTHQLLERVFALLDTLEAPPKKGRNGAVLSNTSPQLSSFIFAVSMDNLFTAVPGPVARAAADRVARQITGSASTNALKFYGALVRRVAAAAASSSASGSSAPIFVPRLLNQLFADASPRVALDDLEIAPLSEDELVWRLRMLAQVCRACGGGLQEHVERIAKIVSLSFARSERRVYKAGGRLLRGLLEGLTAVSAALEGGSGDTVAPPSSAAGGGGGGVDKGDEDGDEGLTWKIEWNVPSAEGWSLGASLVARFLDEAEALVRDESGGINLDRDVLFRALRLIHAAQRGGRWIMAGVVPERFLALDKFAGDDESVAAGMSKADAVLALRKPAAAGLGGERDDPAASRTATLLWTRAYTSASDIISAVLVGRPDDGALLYRCLEPLELAHEPFRRSNQGRLSSHACRGYKSAYHPVIATKRRFDAVGGVGRAMPRFIFKLRIEAQHEMRLSVAARGGINCDRLFDRIMRQATDLAVNAFPRVRGEARGVLTRAWRVAHPLERRREVERVIDVLSSAASATEVAQKEKALQAIAGTGSGKNEDARGGGDLQYEIMIGASSVLRSAAAAPLLMREWDLFDRVARVLLKAIVVAERPDASAAVGTLFAKLAGLARPLSIYAFRLATEDLCPNQAELDTAADREHGQTRLAMFNGLNLHLIGMVSKPEAVPTGVARGDVVMTDVCSEISVEAAGKADSRDAHWRLQSLVATVLTICLHEDLPPPTEVATFFAESMVSDVVSLRHISARAVALIFAMHGRKPAHGLDDDRLPAAVLTLPVPSNPALAAIERVMAREGFGRTLVHTLALDHDDGMGADGSSGGQAARSFGVFNFSRYVDGDACWSMMSGRPWPSSWVSRSRDAFNIVQVRLYEALCRVYGSSALSLLGPVLNKLISAADAKEERIIDGVRDENVRVIAGELVAGMARGLAHGADGIGADAEERVYEWTERLLSGFTGPTGAINGGSLVRLVLSASRGTVGNAMSARVVASIISQRPMVVPMDKGAVAHLQARRLRYAHACVADLEPMDDTVAVAVMRAALEDLTSQVAFGHELKTVREEVARLLTMLATFKCGEAVKLYGAAVQRVAERQSGGSGEANSNGGMTGDDAGARDELKKYKSRQGETLSRWTSVMYWNGDALSFSKHLPVLMPAIVASLDEESDQDRVSHARLALSLAAQGSLEPSSMVDLVKTCEVVSKSPRYRVRGALLPFLQVLSFSLLFTANDETLSLMRQIVTTLLSDSQLEVREAAGGTFVSFVRDAPTPAVAKLRKIFMTALKRTSKRAPRGKRAAYTPEEVCERHGAVLGLGSMVAASPYDVPAWMPGVLVALADAINDPPPVSTTTRNIFADFMRTHRDEWQVHKLAFSEDELERVSELMVSPSYYA